jgi:hypothetical protein
MPLQTRRALAVAAVTAAALGTGVAPTPADASPAVIGHQTFRGFIVTSGVSGDRDVVLTRIVARGVFDGVGRIVEVPGRPGDPDDLSRDNFVFRAGTMHVVSVNTAFDVHLNPKTCRLRATIEQTSRVTGGTRQFRHAAGDFASRIRGFGVLSRKPNGRCDQGAPLLHEVDFVSGRGQLRY